MFQFRNVKNSKLYSIKEEKIYELSREIIYFLNSDIIKTLGRVHQYRKLKGEVVVALLRSIQTSYYIEELRQRMNNLAKQKGISHPGVLLISQELDKKIIEMQKIIKRH